MAEVIDNTASGSRTIKFSFAGDRNALKAHFSKIGKPPLPRLLGRAVEPEDYLRYQTIYANKEGGLVPPYAGLHWTPYLLKLFEVKGVHVTPITQHLSLQELSPISAKELNKHTIRPLYFVVPNRTAEVVNEAKENGKRVVAVGTSSLQTMESSVSVDQGLRQQESWTNLFFFPPAKFRITDALLTNFQLPNTIPFINALAFGGSDLIMEAYRTAIREKYRFFVYGDALLIL